MACSSWIWSSHTPMRPQSRRLPLCQARLPRGQETPRRGFTPGAWRVPEGDFVPFAVETGGRLDARARAFLASFVCMCIGKPRKEFTKEDLKWYARAMRELLDSVTVAVAKSVATTLLNASRVAGEDVAPEAGEEEEDGASEAG